MLINKNTASAAELLVSALKYCNNAILVGEKTHGKGLMQECYEFADGTSLKISTHEMLLPSKERIEGKGISPDYMCKTNKLKCCLSIIDSFNNKNNSRN